jgi:hypothetical protein
MNYTKGEWKAGYNPGVTGPTTPSFQPFCGGVKWPYKTINVGTETIAIVPAQTYNRGIGKHAEPLIDGGMANAHLISAAPDMYESLKKIKTAFTLGQIRNTGSPILDTINKALIKAEGQEGK